MGRILKAANQLIEKNPHVFEKKLWSDLGYGDPLRVVVAADEQDEALKVASAIIHHRLQHKANYRDFAILYRGNHQSRLFEKVLREHRIPYTLSGGTSFFSHTEVKDIMAYLRLLVNPDDDSAFLRVVNTPRRELGAATIEKLGSYATMRGIGLFAASFEVGLRQHLGARAMQRLSHFTEWLVEIGDRGRRGDPVATARDLIRDIDYHSWLNDSSNDLKQAERRMANVEELLGWLGRMAADEENEGLGLTEMVAKMSLMDILERQNEEEEGDSVRMMTLHASKGLEFPHVFLAGMEEELLPHRVSIEEDNIEEERRLAYVGITRAQRTLTITLAARRRRAGELVRCEPSRFLAELPEDDLSWEGKGIELPEEERQQRGRAHLANLKGMLGS
jgi:ATP-dependent DNA helicase Rep